MDDWLKPRDLAILLGVCSALWILKAYISFRRLANGVDNAPGTVTLFGEVLLSRLLPPIPGIFYGFDWAWRLKYSEYKARGSDILATMALLPQAWLTVQMADAEAIKVESPLTTPCFVHCIHFVVINFAELKINQAVMANRAAFPKPVEEYQLLNLFGPNIVSTEHDEWKRHRKVVAKAFTEPNNKLVWQETVGIMLDLFTLWELEGRANEVVVENAADLTKNIALMVISAAAFGMSLTWKEDDTLPPGHAMTFKQTLHCASAGGIHRVAFPDWILSLYGFGRQTLLAYKELKSYMVDMIEKRTTAPASRQDLFSNLLKAREEEKDGATVFSDADLMGNIFIIIFAGHDTTSHTLAFALGLLALYPEVQERLLAQIIEVVAPGQLPAYADIPNLSYALAIMQETLRLFPIVTDISKYSLHDTSFSTEGNGSSKRLIPVPAGTHMKVDITGLHYNTKYWDDPEAFKPERFLTGYNKNAWAAFAAGPRACIGRRFAEIEIIAVLTLLVKYYKIEVTYEPKFAPETFEERKKRVLKTTMDSILLKAVKVPVTFKRR